MSTTDTTTAQRCWHICRTSIGGKAVVALTGLLLVGFVLAHVAGNLLIFLGQDALNGYAKKLTDMPVVLWSARAGLLAVLVVHMVTAARLVYQNHHARPVSYAVKNTVQASIPSRTMLLSGLLMLAFIIYHLLHFTVGVTHPDHFHLIDSQGRHDVYSMVILGFQDPRVAVAYIVAMVLLGVHLSHGIPSLFQSLGIDHPTFTPCIHLYGPLVALVIVVGFIAIPVSVWLGFLQLPAGGG